MRVCVYTIHMYKSFRKTNNRILGGNKTQPLFSLPSTFFPLPLLSALNSWQAVSPRQQEGNNDLFGDAHLTELAATETYKRKNRMLYHYLHMIADIDLV